MGRVLGPLIVGRATAEAAKLVGVIRVGRIKVELGWVARVVTAVSSLRVAERPDVALCTHSHHH